MDPIVFVPPVLAGVVTALALGVLLKRARLPLDQPNERSLHSTPVPRSGGLAVVPAIMVAWLLSPHALPWQIPVACTALFVVSALDDLRGLPVIVRFACHLAAAAAVAVALLGLGWGLGALACAVIALAWMINLYNFMDGSDGLAGGMALIGFLAYGLGAWLGGDVMLASACWTISAAAAGFLFYNVHPARVFLGDAGSTVLGLLAGSLGLLGWLRGLWPLWFPLLVFSPFIVDATVTLARRILRGEKAWQAHRDHYYQRLVRCGWGHGRTAVAEYALMSGCALAALAGLGRSATTQASLLISCALVYVALMTLIDRTWRRHAEES